MFSFINHLNVGHRLWINVGMAIITIVTLLIIVMLEFRDNQMSQRQMEMRGLTETAYGVIERYGQLAATQSMTEEDAKKQAADAVKDLRYGDVGYFWINDTNPVMIMHPHKPALNGKRLNETKDPNGKRLFVSFVEVAQANAEGGIVDYVWPKPGQEEAQPKISYVKLYQPWGWIVGTGVYVDDINAAFLRQTTTLGIVIAVLSVMLILVSALISKSILIPVRKLEKAIAQVAENGDLTVRAKVTQGGELGSMGCHFDEMLARLQKFTNEVGNAVTEMTTASTKLSTITEKTQSSIEIELTQTTQVATAMTEMTATVKDIASSASTSAEATVNADSEVEQGTRVVNEAT
ncbi:MAG: methyl-accepting chemotaxis protein, partial [Candidatus Thiodiazotropha sp. (ex Lucinoma borealis)]|nr:methyl-accepting chemotaxis protein [Candidatus Thiodiazotropha sp. (ex Lucinoma borealis)]